MRGWAVLFLVGCAATPNAVDAEHAILVHGKRVAVDARVVLWTDPGGFDARPHFGSRNGVRPTQIVLHYDAAGTSERCHRVLQKRGLSAHFLLDRDGTVYQTVDVEARAWHASEANSRSVGIEIANLGAYGDAAELDRVARLTGLPNGPKVDGVIQGQRLHQVPFTDEQYEALARLCGALCRSLSIPATAPSARGITGDPTRPGILGHYHLTRRKVDPGPAFDWDRFLAAVRRHL